MPIRSRPALFLWLVLMSLALLAPEAQAKRQNAYGLVLVIDAGLFRKASAAVVDGMLSDIDRMERSAPHAKLAIIASDRGRSTLLRPDSRARLNLDRFIRTHLHLDKKTQSASTTLNLNNIREELFRLDALWDLSVQSAPDQGPRVVLVRVFALRWYLDRLAAGAGDLYTFEYPNTCVQGYTETNRRWPASTTLDIEFRPPLGQPSPPEGAMSGFIIALTGQASQPENVVFRGWAGPNCESGEARAIANIAHSDPTNPICKAGTRRAVQGPEVSSCSAAPVYPPVAADLVRRPVNLVIADGDGPARAAMLLSAGSALHRADVTVDGRPLPTSGQMLPVGQRGSHSAPIHARLSPKSACRNPQLAEVFVQTYGPASASPLQDRTLVVSDAPCIPLEFPMGELRVR